MKFVNYSQALSLRKLGFDWKVNHLYLTKSDNDEIEMLGIYENFNSHDSKISAPTLSETQEWLRKEKGLYLIWDMGQNRKHNSKFAWYVCDCHGYIVDVLASEIKYNSPEEALSEGISECLKYIENKEGH